MQERYRSNSLDSILVSDLNSTSAAAAAAAAYGRRGNPTAVLQNRNSAFEMHPDGNPASPPGKQQEAHLRFFQHPNVNPPPGGHLGGLLLMNQGGGVGGALEKRPTFEGGLDKRKSWSVDVGGGGGGGGVGNKMFPSAAAAAAAAATAPPPARTRPPVAATAAAAAAATSEKSAPTPGQLRNARGKTLREVQQMQANPTAAAGKKPTLALNSKG